MINCLKSYSIDNGLYGRRLLLAAVFFVDWNTSVVPISHQWQWNTLQWRRNERDGVSNHQPHDCLLNRLFRRTWKKTSKLRVTGFCEGNSPVTGEFPSQRTSNAENISISWPHRSTLDLYTDHSKQLNTTVCLIMGCIQCQQFHRLSKCQNTDVHNSAYCGI